MQSLINPEDVSKVAHLKSFKLNPLTGVLMQILSLDKVNELYNKHQNLKGVEFVNAILSDLNLNIEFDKSQLAKLPESGGFITVSNHPMGGIEGLLLIQILAQKRPDLKVSVNYLLQKIKPLENVFLPVDPFKSKQQKQNSVSGMLQAFRHVRSGGVVSFFPAGEVSTFQPELKAVTDKKWQNGVMKFIQKANVPVVPIYFGGNLEPMFHLLGVIHPTLRTANLANQLFRNKNEKIVVRIGKPIPISFITQFEKPDTLGRYLKAKTYSLDQKLKVKPFFKFDLKSNKNAKPVAEPMNSKLIHSEIETLSDCRIFCQNEFEVYITTAGQIPYLIKEMGRLREITFRQVGEGSGKPRDLDEFDLYYQHMFLWDKDKKQLVGAYRLGKGKEILQQHGKNGFYTASLFRYKKELKPVLNKSIELGRSFIVSDYQRKMLPLFILWKGILYFLLKNKEYRYLLGPVSISNYYSNLSKSLMVEFIRKYHFNAELARFVKPKKRFKVKTSAVNPSDLLQCEKEDLRFVDQLINDIEPNGMAMPVLLKKYIKQNAKIIGFNVDPKFQQALDGLMILDLNDVPKKTLNDLQKDFSL